MHAIFYGIFVVYNYLTLKYCIHHKSVQSMSIIKIMTMFIQIILSKIIRFATGDEEFKIEI